MGIGVGFLFAPLKGEELRHLLSERFDEFRHSLPEDSTLNHYAHQLSDRVGYTREHLRDYAQQTVSKAIDTGSTLGNRAMQSGQDMAHKAMDAGHDLASKARQNAPDMAHRAMDAGHDLASKARQNAPDMAHKAVQTGQDIAHKAKQTGQDMSHRIKHTANAGPSDNTPRRVISESDTPHGRAE